MGRLLIRGEPGHDIVPELYPLDAEPIIDKPGHGAFAHTDFELLLRIKGIRNLVIVGVTTDVCVSTTMREANDRGFDCLLLEDGSAATESNLHVATCESIKLEGGIFGTTAKLDDLMVGVESVKEMKATLVAARSERLPSPSSTPRSPDISEQITSQSTVTPFAADRRAPTMPISAVPILPPYLS
jgi:hypothetical protein